VSTFGNAGHREDLDVMVRVCCICIFGLLAVAAPALAAERVVVKSREVIREHPRIGINVDYLRDHPANEVAPIRTFPETLKAMGLAYLRYPGGEKSDNYLWSVPPWPRTEQPTPNAAMVLLGEYVPEVLMWPTGDPSIPPHRLGFDEFVTYAKEAGAEPVIVVAYDALYNAEVQKRLPDGGRTPLRRLLLDAAVAWVRYANIIKGYGIRYWEIGNESYSSAAYAGLVDDPVQYAEDVKAFSRAMKAVDPMIRVGVNGARSPNPAWWPTILRLAVADIDFLSVHEYPTGTWTGYETYDAGGVTTPELDAAIRAIEENAPPDERDRIRVAVTETNVITWNGPWPNTNDLGHALVLFDLLGTQLTKPRNLFSLVWNTRWAQQPLLDALASNNDLLSIGRAVAVWGQFLGTQLVKAESSDPHVVPYASRSGDASWVTIFIINKARRETEVMVSLEDFSPSGAPEHWVFAGQAGNNGTPESDPDPTLQYRGMVPSDRGTLALTLQPCSITVVRATAEAR